MNTKSNLIFTSVVAGADCISDRSRLTHYCTGLRQDCLQRGACVAGSLRLCLRTLAMDKVQILTTCHVCHGASYLPTNEVMSNVDGRTYVRHVPCTACAGSGSETRWIDIRDFVDLLFEHEDIEND